MRHMTEKRFTLIDDGQPAEVPARIQEKTVWLHAADVRAALGWELKPEGLCRGPACVPIREQDGLAHSDDLNLAALARALGRPLALDVDERAAYLGAAAADRAAQLASLQAADFTLPDLHGATHSLSDSRGKKILLIAYASW